MLETNFQKHLIVKIKLLFEGCMIFKNDPNYIQGVPDLIILYKNKWAMLEVKRSNKAPKQPNQEYYVNLLNSMSYAAFIHPDNESEVINDLQRAFEIRR